MTRHVERLTTAKVRHAKVGLHPDGGGLYLQVTTRRDGQLAKSWFFRFTRKGQERRMGLGSLHTVGLGEARQAAAIARKIVLAGKDPIEERDAMRALEKPPAPEMPAANAMTFRRCATLYIDAHRAGWRSADHYQQWMQSLRDHVYPTLGDRSVDDIDLNAVLSVITPIWNTLPETASRVRSRIELVLDWARVRGYRDGENPARWRGHLKHLLPSPAKLKGDQHYSAMPYEALPAFLVQLRGLETTAARALEFLILTAARRGEALGARWDEIDIVGKVWAIPGPRMKGGKPHRVPITDRAIEILDSVRGLDPVLVFASANGKPMHMQTMWRTIHRSLGVKFSVHGFRSSFKDWCAECTSAPDWVSEKALAHIVGDETRRAYQRGDLFNKRRRLMDEWSRFCAGPTVHRNVIPLKSI